MGESKNPNPKSEISQISSMDESTTDEQPSTPDQFSDALDDFPYHDCTNNAEPEEEGESVGSSKLSELDSNNGVANEVTITNETHTSKPSEGLRRRSSLGSSSKGDFKGLKSGSSLISETSHVGEGFSIRNRRRKMGLRGLHEEEKKVCERSDFSSSRLSSDKIGSGTKDEQESSSITLANECSRSPSGDLDDNPSSSFLVFVAELVIKAILFQLNLFVKFFTFPVLFVYYSFLFVTSPRQTLNQAREFGKEKMLRIWDVVCESVTPYLDELKGQKSIGKLAGKFGWGFLWAIYVCFMLCCFLIMGFVVGGLMMRYVVEEPFQMASDLNFDYTKSSPVALVPIISCPSVSCGENCKEQVEFGKFMGSSRVIPPNHKLQLMVSLTLPESDYNKKLGIFQVRVEFLSANGIVLASSKHPCMLHFKSPLITYLGTFIKSVPLLAGYSSEAQVLSLKMRGFTEGFQPTSCIRVILEQRAEYSSGGGIPEIYTASLFVISELPFYKRILYYWKKTVFIWTSMVLFFMELMLVLLCCRPIIIRRPRNVPSNNNDRENTMAQIQRS